MGEMKGCISFSLYGDGAKYSWGMLENARLAKQFYPGWTVVVHAQRGHYAIPALQREGAEVVEHDLASGGPFWRFLSANDTRFTHAIFRDADSRLSKREAAAVAQWVAYDCMVHSLRDHPWHENIALLGGGWGIKVGAMPIAEWIDGVEIQGYYGEDEAFLQNLIWPKIPTGEILRHTSTPRESWEVRWPTPNFGDTHFGEQIAPVATKGIRCVVLSPEHYARRREGFYASLKSSGCSIRDVEWYRAKTAKERVVPCHVDHAEAHPHYHLATRDHVDIIERSLVEGDEYLMVFEDDARFSPDFDEFFARMWVSLPDDWLGAMVGGAPWTDDCREYVSPETALSLARVRGCLGTHGVLWNRAGMRRAFDHFTYWNRMVIDQAFRGLQHDDPRFYAPAKWIVDIASDVAQFGRDE
jgi:hypothetical protein